MKLECEIEEQLEDIMVTLGLKARCLGLLSFVTSLAA